MNSLLDIGAIRLTSRNLGIHIRQPEGKKPQRWPGGRLELRA
jgi:hypothetical protein